MVKYWIWSTGIDCDLRFDFSFFPVGTQVLACMKNAVTYLSIYVDSDRYYEQLVYFNRRKLLRTDNGFNSRHIR